ncbi:MAG: hypothetical protein ACI87N_002353 [Flavobacteriales bacterium]|jgi:hypothetical protein
MKIRFKKKRLYINLILGLVWTGLGVFSLLEDESLSWTDYGYLVIGILYLGHYLYDLNNQYLKIENGSIRKNILYGFGKKINLNEINRIEKYAGDYILRTLTKELKINTEFIEEKSLAEFNEILKKINLPEGKNAIC